MWNLFKSELRYRRDILILYVLAFIAVFLLTRVFPVKGAAYQRTAFQFQSFMMVFFLAAFPINPWFREKRTRRVMVLPISPRKIAAARLAVELVYWLLLVGMLAVFCLMAPDFVADTTLFYSLTIQTGILFLHYFLLTYLIDILLPMRLSGMLSIVEKIILTLLVFFVIMINFVLMFIMLSAFDGLALDRETIYDLLIMQGWIPLITFVSGLLMAMLSVLFFEHRQGYLEY